MSPQKVRRVLGMVRGKPVYQALAALQYVPSPTAAAVSKVIRSAVANAENNRFMIPDTLKVFLPRANLPPLGRAFIQLLERPGPHSEATEMVKRKIVDTYREPDARIPLMADAV